MAKQIALVEVPIYETTGERGPRVVHDLARFEIFGTLCHVRSNGDGDMLDLSVGHRRFAMSLLDLAATAALAVDAHLRGEIQTRVLATLHHADPDERLSEHHFGRH